MSYTIRALEAIDRAKELNASQDSRKLIWLHKLQQDCKVWMNSEDYQLLVEASGGKVEKV